MPAKPDKRKTTAGQYRLIRSRRRTLALIVRDDGSLEVRSPLRYPAGEIDRFIQEKASWIERKRQQNNRLISVSPLAGEQRVNAEKHIRSRFAVLLQQSGFPEPAGLRIKDQRSRWGSCSSHARIALNSRCACLPAELLDYVILHELCHLNHLNHGPAFWSLLETFLPEARRLSKELSRYRLSQEERA